MIKTKTKHKAGAYLLTTLLIVTLLSGILVSITSADDEKEDSHECVGIIATGNPVLDNRSILSKFRWLSQNNQRPIYGEGLYRYLGVGDGDTSFCRMGMNNVGLVIVNFDPPGGNTLDEGIWEYTSDRSSGSEDNDMINVLANFSTVSEAAYYLAHHAYYPCQWGIISDEPGVGAVVAMDSSFHTNITWVNNTWGAIGNSWYCEGGTTESTLRLDYLINRAIDNDLFYNESQPSKIDIKGLVHITGHDINASDGSYPYLSEPKPGSYTGYYEKKGLSAGQSSGIYVCKSAMYSISGYDRDGDVAMSWLSIGDTPHISPFLPVSASYIESASDIHSLWSTGIGIQQYTNEKKAFAEHNATHYDRKEVHKIMNYTRILDNESFDRYNDLINNVEGSDASALMKNYADTTLEDIVDAYNYNGTMLSRKLIIKDDLSDEDLINFPVLISIPSEISIMCDNGKSIQFWSSDHSTQYNHEIDHWDDTSTSYVWVNITRVSSTKDTVVWFRYNNSGMDDQQNIQDTWDSYYIAVYHMSDDTTSTTLDSTNNENHGAKSSSNNPLQITGKIGYGQNFTNDIINCGNDSSFVTQNLTAEIWFSQRSQGSSGNPRLMGIEASNTAEPWAIEDLFLANTIGLLVNFGAAEVQTAYIPFDYSGGNEWDQWIYGAWSFTSGQQKAYKNNVYGTNDTDAGTLDWGGYDFRIGNSDNGNRDFSGIIDEVRLSNIVRNESWMMASYRTSENPTEYATFDIPTLYLYVNRLSNTEDAVTIGDTFNITEYITAAGYNVESLNWTINYTTNVNYTSMWKGPSPLWGTFFNPYVSLSNDTGDGTGTINETSDGVPCKNISGYLSIINFTAMKVGVCNVTTTYYKIVDCDEDELSASLSDATITIHPARPTSSPSTSDTGEDYILLDWTQALPNGADRFRLYDTDTDTLLYSGTNTEYNHTGVNNETTYHYALYSYNTSEGLLSLQSRSHSESLSEEGEEGSQPLVRVTYRSAPLATLYSRGSNVLGLFVLVMTVMALGLAIWFLMAIRRE